MQNEALSRLRPDLLGLSVREPLALFLRTRRDRDCLISTALPSCVIRRISVACASMKPQRTRVVRWCLTPLRNGPAASEELEFANITNPYHHALVSTYEYCGEPVMCQPTFGERGVDANYIANVPVLKLIFVRDVRLKLMARTSSYASKFHQMR